MVRRESRATDAAGGREWMLAQIREIIGAWRRDLRFQALRHRVRRAGGLAFAARRALDPRRRLAGLRSSRLCHGTDRRSGRDGQRCQCGRDRRGAIWGGEGVLAPVLHDALHRHRRRNFHNGARLARRRFLRRRDRTSHHSPGRSGMPLRRPRLLRTDVLRPLAGARSRNTGERAVTGSSFSSKRYVVDLALGLKAAIMLLNPERIVIGGGITKAGDRLFVPLRGELRPAGHKVVRSTNRRATAQP